MDNTKWAIRDKPYDLRERLFLFGCVMCESRSFCTRVVRSPAALSHQVLRCGTSAGANYEEADDGSSPRDSLAKKRIVLRELKETNFILRVLRREQLLTPAHDPVIVESAELVKIVATIVKNAKSKAQDG